MTDETLAESTAQLLERIRARMAARPAAERDATARRDILSRANEAPLSVSHKYVWVSDARNGGHMTKTWACPPEEEWAFWVANAIDYVSQEFPNALLARLGVEPEIRDILNARLVAWRSKEASGGASEGPPKRRRAPSKPPRADTEGP